MLSRSRYSLTKAVGEWFEYSVEQSRSAEEDERVGEGEARSPLSPRLPLPLEATKV
jgi:hypothetical protein